MAGENLPRGGSVGYEVFDNTDSLGATRTMQNINLLRALEGELARTIGALSPIAAARVHLVLPKRALFNRDRTEPSASIVVTHEPGSRLNKAQVIAVQNLVAAAVPGLKVSRISIVDNDGTLLARSGNGEDDPALATLEAQDRRAAIETRLKNTIEELLERSVGVGKVRAEVNAEVDFDHITTVEEIYDPDGQVARSIQSVEEEGSSSEQDAANDVSVANSLPDANVTQTPGARAANSTTRTEETTNFEISKTVRNHIRESGTIKRLSVAVLVDGVYTTDANGERTYQPRGDQEMQKLAALVRSAIGFDEKRGDTLELANMQFSTVEAPEPIAPPLFNLGKGDYFKIAEIAVLFIVGLLVILLVLRPLATQLLSPPSRGAFAGEGGAQAALPPAGETAQIAAQPEGEESDIDIENVEGRVKHSTIKKVGEIVDNHPDEALGIIRNWLYQEA
ncbi:MAG: flagellar basal-body MS-ring/collar protein FliF, partial [Alphaproteobacteria bacterium]